MLKDVANRYYTGNNYNCAETIIHAGNEYYNLGLHENDMRMMGVFGGGIQTGNTCGALIGAAALLSLRYVEKCAHDSKDIKPAAQMLLRRFKEKMGGTLCCEVKPRFYNKEIRCENTVSHACDIFEETVAEYESKKNA